MILACLSVMRDCHMVRQVVTMFLDVFEVVTKLSTNHPSQELKVVVSWQPYQQHEASEICMSHRTEI